MVELAGLHRLRGVEIDVGKQRAAVGDTTGREGGFGQGRARRVGQVLAAAIVREEAQAHDAVVAGRVAVTRLPVDAHLLQVARGGGAKAVGDDLLLSLVDAHGRVAEAVLPVDAGAVEALVLGRTQRVAAGLVRTTDGGAVAGRGITAATPTPATAGEGQSQGEGASRGPQQGVGCTGTRASRRGCCTGCASAAGGRVDGPG